MLLRMVIIFPILLSAFLNFWSHQTITGMAFAQSLLSDRQFLEQNSEIFSKTKFTRQKITLRPSELSSTPTELLEPVRTQPDTINPSFSIEQEVTQKPVLTSVQSEKRNTFSSNSFLSRFFPWFSSNEQSADLNSYAVSEKQTGKTQKEWANSEHSRVKMLVKDIENLLISDPEAARGIYEEVEDQLMIEERTRLKVQLLYYLNEWDSAEKLANVFLRERPQSQMASLVFYFLNKSLLSQNKPLNQNLIMRENASKSLQPKFRSDFLHLLSDEALLKGDLFTAIQYRLEELNNLETAKSVNLENLENLLKKIQSPEELSILLGDYPNLTWLQDKIFEMKLELLAKLKRHREALKLLDQRLAVARKIGDQEEVEHLEQIQVRFITALNVNPRRIGVILPLSSSSSKVARLAQETLNGLRLALRSNEFPTLSDNRNDNATPQKIEIHGNSEDPDDSASGLVSIKFKGSWELVVRNSHLNPEITKSAVRELVESERVIALIGPLARKTSEAAAEEAERLGVPLISLSLTDSIPELGEFIFRNNQSWKQEVYELLEYAMSELQACRFLILYSKTREGRQKMKLFWDAALMKGCEVVAVEGFKDEGQKSLVNEFDTFTGKIQRISAEDKKILNELNEKEEPIHNFDAVFVAIGSGGVSNLRFIIPYSAVYKMEKTTFLGDSGWNDSALPFAPGLNGVKYPVFVDSFFLKSKTPAMQKMLRLHERILYRHQNYIGPTAYTAYAYDTLMMLIQLLEDEHNHSHRNLRDSLKNMHIYPGVTGNIRFNENGEIQHEMQLLTLRRGKIQPLN